MNAHVPLLEVLNRDRRVPLFDGTSVREVNLDNAATTPALRSVWDVVAEAVPLYGSVHRGAGYRSMVSTTVLERAQRAVTAFAAGGAEDQVAIFTHNATASLNVLARRLTQLHTDGLVVVTSAFEHSSNLLPWRRAGAVHECHAQDTGDWDLEHLAEVLRTTRAQLVAVTAASNVTGRIVNVDDIAAVAHEHGALVAVDASQFVAHRPLLRGDKAAGTHWDFVVFSGHKMYAPFGVGVLVGPRSVFEGGWPDRPGGGTVRLIDGEEVVWTDLPEREAGGTPNYPGLVALAEACTALQKVGFDAIQRHEAALVACARRAIGEIEGLTVHRPLDDESGWLAVFPFSVSGYSHGQVAAYLGMEKGIAVRSGHLCQYELARQLAGVGKSERQRVLEEARRGDLRNVYGVVRASAGPTTSATDLETLGEALRSLINDGPQATYLQDLDGRYRIEGWEPPLPTKLGARW